MEDGMENAGADHLEDQLRSAFPPGMIARVKVLSYGDDPEVDPGQTVARAFFEWPGRLEGTQADPQTVHAFCVANAAALDRLLAELPSFIGWVEFRPDNPPGAVTPEGLSYRIVRHRKQAAAPGEAPPELTPVMARLGPADLATLDSLITAGIANSRAEALRWAVGHIRDHPAYAQLQQRVHEVDERKPQF
jgi:hypothetical protein